jgi:lipopolysaccharide assembly outer membrane protein LptD (OstA)
MDGGVRARNSEGMTLHSDTLRYDDGAETLHGDGNVVIVTAQGEELRGRHFDYDLRTTEMRVTGEGG